MKKPRSVLRFAHPEFPSRILASSTGELIVSAGDTIYFWDTKSKSKAKKPRLTISDLDEGAHQPVLVMDVSPDGKYLCIGAADMTTKVYATDSGERLALLSKPRRNFYNSADQVDFLAGGELLLTVMGKKMEVFRVGDWEKLREIAGHTSKINVIESLPGTSRLISAAGKYVKQWDVQTGKELLSLPVFSRSVADLSISADGKLLATATEGGEVSLWELPKAALRLTYGEHESEVFSVAISPDKALVASSELDDSLHLWNAKNGNLVAKHPLECVDAMSFSPDGKYLAATGGDETWLLETKTGTKVAAFGCGSDLVFLDDKRLVTGDRNDVVIWELGG